jgi:hypothetical protein
MKIAARFNGNFRILKWRYVNVPYVWPYFGGISPYIGLKNRPKIYGIGTSNFYRFLASMAIDRFVHPLQNLQVIQSRLDLNTNRCPGCPRCPPVF